MILRRILDTFKLSKLISKSYIPIHWEDDYCQIELVPQDNLAFLRQQITKVNAFATEHRTEMGFTDIFERERNPVSTLSREIRVDYLKSALSSFGLPELHKIRYDYGDTRSLKNTKTKAFGFPSFTLFFETEDEFVSKIWLNFHLITSVTEYEVILASLYYLGEETTFVLIDWNELKIINLSNKAELNKYLMAWWK